MGLLIPTAVGCVVYLCEQTAVALRFDCRHWDLRRISNFLVPVLLHHAHRCWAFACGPGSVLMESARSRLYSIVVSTKRRTNSLLSIVMNRVVRSQIPCSAHSFGHSMFATNFSRPLWGWTHCEQGRRALTLTLSFFFFCCMESSHCTRLQNNGTLE